LADSLTKSKSPNINLGSSPSRPDTFAVSGHEHTSAPGQYDDGMTFNTGKSFTIGQKREEPMSTNPGPGTYNPDQADAMTKTRYYAHVDMSSSPERSKNLVGQGA